MDNSQVFALIGNDYTVDNIGQHVPTETSREVYARRVDSVNREEWVTAGQMGFQAECRVTMFLYDYEGETVAELDGKRYGIYRTYHSSPDEIELYLGEKAGVK